MDDSVGHDLHDLHDLFSLSFHDGSAKPPPPSATAAAIGLSPTPDRAPCADCSTCGTRTTSGFPVCFSCMMGSDEPIRLVSSERKRPRADVDSFAQSLRSLSGPSRYHADESDGPALVESLSDISDSLSDTLSEGEQSPKRRRSSIPRQRRPSFDDILGALPGPLPGSIFEAAAEPMSPPSRASSEGDSEKQFMFPTPPLRTPTASPTKQSFIQAAAAAAAPAAAAPAADGDGEILFAAAAAQQQAGAIPVVNFPFNRTVVTVQSTRRPSLATGLNADERAALKRAGKGAVIMRVTEDLNAMMTQLFAC